MWELPSRSSNYLLIWYVHDVYCRLQYTSLTSVLASYNYSCLHQCNIYHHRLLRNQSQDKAMFWSWNNNECIMSVMFPNYLYDISMFLKISDRQQCVKLTNTHSPIKMIFSHIYEYLNALIRVSRCFKWKGQYVGMLY